MGAYWYQWAHMDKLNDFFGRYKFTSRVVPIDLERVVAVLLQNTSSGSGTEQVA